MPSPQELEKMLKAKEQEFEEFKKKQEEADKKRAEDQKKAEDELNDRLEKVRKEEKEKVYAKIEKTEKDNLMLIAATYDKMDSSSAAKILTNMCANQTQSGGISSFEDAVKIMRYMADRSKAKVLAELAVSEPKLAAGISQKLKQVIEKE